jgi:bacillithiol biosynthesis deacetylase BshB1
MKLDVLAFAAHPDDVEISCSGTVAKLVAQGKKVGIIDLTQGELGTRGTPEIRLKESEEATKILKLSVRENLGLADGFFEINLQNKLSVVSMLRKYQPEIVLLNSVTDRHPDHGRASQLCSEACFLSGLRKIETLQDGILQKPWRPKNVYHYIQDRHIHPDFIVDISDFYEIKMNALKAFKSQFYDPNSPEPPSPISGKEFFDFIEGRARTFGRIAGVEFAEGFTVERAPMVNDIFDLR